MMAPDVVTVIPRSPYVVRVVFADGEVRDVDIEPLLDGQVFAPLRDAEEFAKAHVDQETGTVAWPNGADLDPDVLYDTSLRPASGRGPRVRVLVPAS
jgi:hypothetical protein